MVRLCAVFIFFVPTLWMGRSDASAEFTLSISRTDDNIQVSWPAEYNGSRLQQRFALRTSWTDVPGTIATYQIQLPRVDRQQFFRLSASIPTAGLVARYDLNSDADDSVAGRNGVIHGATPTSNRFGNSSSAYSFNGTNAFIEIPDNDVFSIAGQFSISVWMRPGTLTFPDSEGSQGKNDYVYWIGKGASDQQEWALRMYNERKQAKSHQLLRL
jgi:hypothetical protein